MALRDGGVNLLYGGGWPIKGGQAVIACIPEDQAKLKSVAAQFGVSLVEDAAFLIEGEDRVGALCEVAGKLGRASINIHCAQALAAGGRFAALITVRDEDVDRAAQALGV